MNPEPTESPHAIIAEKSVLSAMFQQPGRISKAAAEGINDESFHIPAHREILAHLRRMRDQGHLDDHGCIDLTVFVQSAQMDGILQRMGGPSNIVDINGYAPVLAGWSAWCEQLRECKARRIAQDASQSISGSQDSQEAIKAATDALEALKRAVTAKSRSTNAKTAADDFIRRYLDAAKSGDIPGISTGIGEVDAVTGGMRPGELWTVGGKSSAGKSVLMFQIAAEFVAAGRPCGIFSLELMPHEIVGRLITLFAKVRHDAITRPQEVTKQEMQRIQTALAEFSNARLWMDATARQTLDTISAEAERIRDIEGRIDLIVVDYIQIVNGERNRNESREQEIARVSSGLKQLAKAMECPVITGTQLNEAGQTRESRAIEQDSDVLLMIQEDGLLMKKVRNGARGGIINICLDGEQQRFRYFSHE